MEGKLRFKKIDKASLIDGRKFTRGGGGLYLEGQFNGGFLRYEFGGLYLEELIFRILWYCNVVFFCSRNLDYFL